METEKYLVRVDTSSNSISKYQKVIGGGFVNLFKRIRIVGIKYILYIVYRLLKPNKVLKCKLIFDEILYAPLIDPNARQYYFFGAIGPSEAPLTKYFIQTINSNDVCYDIGANYGFYTILFEKFAPNGEVHSFEPNRSCVEVLKKSVQDLQRVFVNQVGVYDCVGDLPFYGKSKDYGKGTAANSLDETVKNNKGFCELYSVSTITLDEYCQTNVPPTIIKLDIEGGEYKALLGAKNTLKKHSPTIAMEIWGGGNGRLHSQKAVSFLFTLGYRLYIIRYDGSFYDMKSLDYDQFESGYYNCLFKK